MSKRKLKGRQGDYSKRKIGFFKKLRDLVETYTKILLINVDNVSSSQLQKIRKMTREDSILLMGKNTLIRKCMRELIDQGNENLTDLVDQIVGNIGLLFTHGDLNKMKEDIESLKVAAPAKPGAVAPVDVVVPAGPTGLEPTATSFLQALNISTKIARGQVEILQPHKLITAGIKVKPGEAALLDKLGIMPFSYHAKAVTVYENGFVYPSGWLEKNDRDILAKFGLGVAQVAALSLEIGYPNISSVPHSIGNAFRSVMAISIETDFNIEGAEAIKEYLANPDAFTPAASAGNDAPPAAAAAAVVEDPSESESDSMEIDLFG